MISPCIFHQYHYPIMVIFPWYSHDYPHYQKSDVNGLFSNISWITSHLTSYSHTNFPLHQQKYYNGEAPNDSEVDTPNFISYMVIICFLFGYYGLCDVFSHGITIVFPNAIHRVCTNQHRVARGLRLGDLQGRHGTSLVNPIIEVEKTGCWFEILWKMCYDFPY